MNRRCHLGSIYTEYPAKRVGEYLGGKLFKLISAIIGCVLWTAVYALGCVIVNFLNNNILKADPPTEVRQIFMSELSLWILLATDIVVAILVFRSRIGDPSKSNRKKVRHMPEAGR